MDGSRDNGSEKLGCKVTLPLFFTTTAACAGLPAQAGSQLTLDGDEARHAVNARRITVGEHVLLSDGAGFWAECEVTHTEKQLLEARVVHSGKDQKPHPSITIVQALAKGGRDEQAVETCTEFGAMRFIPWQSSRSIASWKGKEHKGKARWEATAKAAAKQARRTFIPRVENVVSTRGLPALLDHHTIFICHEEAQLKLAHIPFSALFADSSQEQPAQIAIIIGPEGGISPEELDFFTQAGATPVLLGNHVLRSATAGAYAIATIFSRIDNNTIDNGVQKTAKPETTATSQRAYHTTDTNAVACSHIGADQHETTTHQTHSDTEDCELVTYRNNPGKRLR